MTALNTLLILLTAVCIPGLINRTRAVLAGRPTMGTLDYTNPVMVEYDEFIFTYPISRTAASLEGEGVDERGVQPDVLVPWTPEECTADLLAQKALAL